MKHLIWPCLVLSFALATAAGIPASAADCGQSTPCAVEGGQYRIALPASLPSGVRIPALVYFHGYQATSDGAMRNERLRHVADELGIALIAPDGAGKTWSLPGSPSRRRDEFGFIDAVLDDALARFPIDADRIVASGFSMGGSMAWFAACFRGERFAAFLPVAGAYWDPIPTECPSPPPLMIHVHGTTDTVVPMAGRPIRDAYRQSDVGRSFANWADRAQCGPPKPAPGLIEGLTCEAWQGCSGATLALCLHGGGHMVNPDWIADGWQAVAEQLGWPVRRGE